MADKVCPADLLNMTKLVGTALTARHVPRFTARMQVLICERLIAPLVVDLELRRGLADLAEDEDNGRADRKAAKAWLCKLLGIEPL